MPNSTSLPLRDYAVFDLEATRLDTQSAEIWEIAAVAPGKAPFQRYVSVKSPLPDWETPAGREVWSGYFEQARPLAEVLSEFLLWLGDLPLAGHNIIEYDLPVLTRSLAEVGLELPNSGLPLDTLHWARLVFPTPPEELRGYRLGDLYAYFSGHELKDAHTASADAAATQELMTQLAKVRLPEGVSASWHQLGLNEAQLYPWHLAPTWADMLSVPARVDWVHGSGQSFPNREELASSGLAGQPRPTQLEMMDLVRSAMEQGEQLLVQAPTGTGKTRGYLFPALNYLQAHPDQTVVVATHTKVLQEQALQELKRINRRGYTVGAVTVKSPGEYICLEALHDQLSEASAEDPESQEALGLLVHYVARGEFDLGAIPKSWDHQAGYRNLRMAVATNPARCRKECPFFNNCAYQTDLRQRAQVPLWITNQAWLLAHQKELQNKGAFHLVIDEAHNLEDGATAAFTKVVSKEETLHHLNWIYQKQGSRERGWLKASERIPPELREQAREVRQKLLPQARQAFRLYDEALEGFLKQNGEGEASYGLSLVLAPRLLHQRSWNQVKSAEATWINSVKDLRAGLEPFRSNHWLWANLTPSYDFFTQVIDLHYERMRAVAKPDPDTVHESRWQAETGFAHLAIPVDVAEYLSQFWPAARSITLTSATLTVGQDFSYTKRVLGLEAAQERALEPVLPYDQAALIVPSHLPEARSSQMLRFNSLYWTELKTLLPLAQRSLSLFTSTARLQEAADHLAQLPWLYTPLTRREREDVARVMQVRENPGSALGSRSYMEGVDFPDLKVVNLERIPFPVPSALLAKRQERAAEAGLDPWEDVYLPRAILSFSQAFGRLIRDNRERAGAGAFILWDKRILDATYQELFFAALPKGVRRIEPSDRREFYQALGAILGIPAGDLPQDELRDEPAQKLAEIQNSGATWEERCQKLGHAFYELELEPSDPRAQIQLEGMQAAEQGLALATYLPTGFGKSLIFQIPAFLQEGLTLVVSPLIALMKDQAENLQAKGLPAAAVHSGISSSEQRALLHEARAGKIKLLYVSPERLNRSQELKLMLTDLVAREQLNRVVYDEAHCISEWGHDFRPDYRQSVAVLRELAPDVPITASTATANPKVREELASTLNLEAATTLSVSSDRPNLSYYCYGPQTDTKKLKQVAQILTWLDEQFPQDSAIIYAATRKQTERLAWALGRLGFPCEAYHAGLSPLVRSEIQNRFMNGEVKFIVATNAFGMGVDKANIRAVIHYQPPASLAAYIQEAGRAGRDGRQAYAVMLYGNQDWKLHNFIARHGLPETSRVDTLVSFLNRQASQTWRGYANDLIEQCNQLLSEEQPKIDPGDINSVLGSMEEAGMIDYEYRIGKAKLLVETGSDLASLADLSPTTLARLGYRGSPKGDSLDFSILDQGEAEAISDRLYDLYLEKRIRVYAPKEAVLEITLKSTDKLSWNTQIAKAKRLAEKQLERVQHYNESNLCKRQTLLAEFEETITECSGCQVCANGDAPWHSLHSFSDQELEDAYNPLHTVVAFMELHAGRQANNEYHGLGKVKINMALRGEEVSFSPTNIFRLGPRELNNPYFGRLAFIRASEIERAIEKAEKLGYLSSQPYENSSTYQITEAGRNWLLARIRKEQGGASA